MTKKNNLKNISNLNTANKKIFLSCANTCAGFMNYFDIISESQNLEKIYTIKGCGASSLLEKIASNAADKKYSLEYFLCPSDLNRLNGIIIKELKTAVISEELNISVLPSKNPVIIESIINLGDFYDETKLIKRKKEIFDLTAKKNEYIKLAYKFLKAANELCENTITLSKKYINREKLEASIGRLISKQINEKHSQETRRNVRSDEYKFINSVSASGNNEISTFENEAKKIFYISNENFLGLLYTEKISENLKHLCKVICPDALNPERIRALYIKDSKILFVIKNKIADKIYDDRYNFINMERFVNQNFKKENKQKLRFIQKCYKSITEEAVKYFKEAEETSKAIEGIYASSAKNDEKSKYTDAFIQKILA